MGWELLSGFDIDTSLEWHYMEAHYGKGPMIGVGGTIKKNVVFREGKSGRLSISSPKEFADATQKLVPSIGSLCLRVSEMMEETTEIDNAPAIPKTLQIHHWKRKVQSTRHSLIDFLKLIMKCLRSPKCTERFLILLFVAIVMKERSIGLCTAIVC